MPRVTGVHTRGPLTSTAQTSTPINSMMALANLLPTFWLMNSEAIHLEMWGGDGLCSPKLRTAVLHKDAQEVVEQR